MSLDRFVRCELDRQYNTVYYGHTDGFCSLVTPERLLVCCFLKVSAFLVVTNYIQDLPYVVRTDFF
jgi:hypothetical protein